MAAFAVLGALALAPAAAHAAGCQDSWIDPAGGSWFEGSDWSTGAPPREGEEACIGAAGTYTVAMTQAAEGVTLKALTIGGASGAQTLSLGGACSPSPRLRSVSGVTVEANGVLRATKSSACSGNVGIAGPLTNRGTLAIEADAEYSTDATLLNEGAIELANGTRLLAGRETTVANAAGTIASTGTGNLFVREGTFDQGAGSSSGEPVYLDAGSLDLTGRGAISVTTLGASTLSGSEVLYKGQKLAVKGTCLYGGGELTRAGALQNEGTIVLASPDSCDYLGNLRLGADSLVNKGTFTIEAGPHVIQAETEVLNEKTFSLAAAANVDMEGRFKETPKATFDYGIGPPGDGHIRAFGATIAGTLSLQVAKGYIGALGHNFGLLEAPGIHGTFAKVKSATIKSKVERGLYYRPGYGLSNMGLVVAQVVLSATPNEALPGATVHLLGAGFPAYDPVKLSFEDAKKTRTTFANTEASYNGFGPAEVKIPVTAAAGKGTFTAQDTVTGVQATVTLDVI